MIGKRIQFHDETWHELRVLASESMKSFPELADEAFNDLLRKHGRPATLKRRCAGAPATAQKSYPSRANRTAPKKEKIDCPVGTTSVRI